MSDDLRLNYTAVEYAQLKSERDAALADNEALREALLALLSVGMPAKYAELTKWHPEDLPKEEAKISALVSEALSTPHPGAALIERVRREERERCARLVEATPPSHEGRVTAQMGLIADRIRALSDTKADAEPEGKP